MMTMTNDNQKQEPNRDSLNLRITGKNVVIWGERSTLQIKYHSGQSKVLTSNFHLHYLFDTFSSLALQQGVGNRQQIRYVVRLDIFCYMVDLSSSG